MNRSYKDVEEQLASCLSTLQQPMVTDIERGLAMPIAALGMSARDGLSKDLAAVLSEFLANVSRVMHTHYESQWNEGAIAIEPGRSMADYAKMRIAQIREEKDPDVPNMVKAVGAKTLDKIIGHISETGSFPAYEDFLKFQEEVGEAESPEFNFEAGEKLVQGNPLDGSRPDRSGHMLIQLGNVKLGRINKDPGDITVDDIQELVEGTPYAMLSDDAIEKISISLHRSIKRELVDHPESNREVEVEQMLSLDESDGEKMKLITNMLTTGRNIGVIPGGSLFMQLNGAWGTEDFIDFMGEFTREMQSADTPLPADMEHSLVKAIATFCHQSDTDARTVVVLAHRSSPMEDVDEDTREYVRTLLGRVMDISLYLKKQKEVHDGFGDAVNEKVDALASGRQGSVH